MTLKLSRLMLLLQTELSTSLIPSFYLQHKLESQTLLTTVISSQGKYMSYRPSKKTLDDKIVLNGQHVRFWVARCLCLL